eukprot:gene18181-21658_t
MFLRTLRHAASEKLGGLGGVSQVATAAGVEVIHVLAMDVRIGARHPIGGAWAGALLAAAGAFTSLTSAA